MNEDVNDEFDIKNETQSEDCELDNAEIINIHKTVDIELSDKISCIFCQVENSIIKMRANGEINSFCRK